MHRFFVITHHPWTFWSSYVVLHVSELNNVALIFFLVFMSLPFSLCILVLFDFSSFINLVKSHVRAELVFSSAVTVVHQPCVKSFLWRKSNKQTKTQPCLKVLFVRTSLSLSGLLCFLKLQTLPLTIPGPVEVTKSHIIKSSSHLIR